MATNLLYLDNTYLFEAKGVAKATGRDEKGSFVILDQSNFHPQGGGQPADKGFLAAGDTDVPVTFVGFRDGDVLHYVPEAHFQKISVGQQFELRVDSRHRTKNACLHTGGHLVGHVLEAIEPKLVPIKGYHFLDGSYVEFLNDRAIDANQLIDRANEAIQGAISRRDRIETSYSNFDVINKIRPHLAPFVPKDKPSRIVTIGDYVPLPCGGTHIANLDQIGAVLIRKTKRAKDNVRISYEVRESLN